MERQAAMEPSKRSERVLYGALYFAAEMMVNGSCGMMTHYR